MTKLTELASRRLVMAIRNLPWKVLSFLRPGGSLTLPWEGA